MMFRAAEELGNSAKWQGLGAGGEGDWGGGAQPAMEVEGCGAGAASPRPSPFAAFPQSHFLTVQYCGD